MSARIRWTNEDDRAAMAALEQIAQFKINGRTFTKSGQTRTAIQFTSDFQDRKFMVFPIGRDVVPDSPEAVGYRVQASNGGTIAGFVIENGEVVFPSRMYL